MKLTKSFQLSEFACNDGTQVPENLIPNVKELAKNLQVLRDEIGESLTINSGYRSPAWNKKVGGAKNSMHLKAMASDLVCKSLTPKQLKAVIEKLIKEGKMKNGGIGLYPSFVHYDIGATRRW
jgi:uncharacterized protein YcbK (DUF882 family)